jgi:ribosomal protein S27E
MAQTEPKITEAVNQELACRKCGATVNFAPGTSALKCQYCGAENPIERTGETIEEIDLEKFILQPAEKSAQIIIRTVQCPGCGARTTLADKVTAAACPYCDTRLVVASGGEQSIIKPRSLVPFVIDKQKSSQFFQKWIKKFWFAPRDFMSRAACESMDGMYVPYWTYDARTFSQYTGWQGTRHDVSENYSAQEGGRTVSKTRQVRTVRWSPCAGSVDVPFDDVLVPATRSLPEKIVGRLNPWNLGQLTAYDDRFLSGFRCEAYGVDVKLGLDQAKAVMKREIDRRVRQDIGGDEQRIQSLHSRFEGVTFKHILLPVWISSYRYNGKVYRFLVNGQTGEVQGERPYSVFKIIAAVLAALLAALALYFIIAA